MSSMCTACGLAHFTRMDLSNSFAWVVSIHLFILNRITEGGGGSFLDILLHVNLIFSVCKTYLDYINLVISVRLCFLFELFIFKKKKKKKSLTENSLFLTLVCLLFFVTCLLVIRLVFLSSDCVNFYLLVVFLFIFLSGVLRVFCGIF